MLFLTRIHSLGNEEHMSHCFDQKNVWLSCTGSKVPFWQNGEIANVMYFMFLKVFRNEIFSSGIPRFWGVIICVIFRQKRSTNNEKWYINDWINTFPKNGCLWMERNLKYYSSIKNKNDRILHSSYVLWAQNTQCQCKISLILFLRDLGE